ncbi:MAG: hypothetical protein UY31_C0041G0009 [Candidatus Wolfebacteria bacterium GW2011_GWE1_48_7]|uniref:Transcriptional repressor PaaX-like central Cas2-like domain-containing protein n=2 Tax=Candidatus Wolfeibacteriota TaxID=1752735 RepID=A0A0G1U8F1_9BACT|nr:MAG: Putative regulator [Candidatus Wolfebacteria bacterium GW2011_GWB1_47_1]KKU34965.1 MAG: hypothetical protein UX49_C0031G0003 [Candidatus Wolfebacteria bacterium GW2011_GWC2_46_275]KKU42028.1 MAG: hypothetical protein UX58_C0004G0087 [Candidatus Wolfebacteria bacterium GW2011_GWB2_46_69]KKU54435.1 MAG: hypothetical protein UX76_C0002G0028 [Candidatus Wolfebacteria bacterium GW2011_GWC1_47_103]KKU59763.1 MAG: hypothetical protein UX83_C0002G0050 [Candidatus Wolfebacteria bacterium GW2011_
MKYKSSLLLLKAIGRGITLPLDLFDMLVESGYGASASKDRARNYAIELGQERKRTEREVERKRMNGYHSLIYKLKRDGLILEEGKGNKKRYFLTDKGGQKLEILKTKEGFPDPWYSKGKGNRVIIVMFDIPEVQTKKRVWLRLVLNNLDFKMAQKSVWIGKTKIPKELIADLVRMQLENYVEIFEVGSTGNLKHLL